MHVSPTISRWLRNLVALAFGAWISWAFFHKELWSVWHHLQGLWLLLAAVTTAVTLWVRFAKWHLLLVQNCIPCCGRESARSLFGAYALGSITPGRLGDYGRCLFTCEGQRGRTFLYTLVDKSFDLWAVASFAVTSLFLFLEWKIALGATLAWLGTVPLCILAGRHFAPVTGGLPAWLERPQKIWEALQKIAVRRFTAWALGASALDLLTLFCLLRAFHPAAFKVAFATYPWLVIAGALPVSLGGLGPREGLSAFLLPLFSVPSSVAVNVSLLFFGFTAILPAILGAVWLIIQPPSLGRRWWTNLRKTLPKAESVST